MEQRDYVVYTDGSVEEGTNNGGSGAFVSHKNGKYKLHGPAGFVCSSTSAEPELAKLFNAVKQGIYKKHVRLLESTKVVSPMVISWMKPTILMPMGIISRLPVDQVESLLIHELHHIRRHDFLWNVLQRVAGTGGRQMPAAGIPRQMVIDGLAVLGNQEEITKTTAPST